MADELANLIANLALWEEGNIIVIVSSQWALHHQMMDVRNKLKQSSSTR